MRDILRYSHNGTEKYCSIFSDLAEKNAKNIELTNTARSNTQNGTVVNPNSREDDDDEETGSK